MNRKLKNAVVDVAKINFNFIPNFLNASLKFRTVEWFFSSFRSFEGPLSKKL